jgi:L-ascorbate metabolism protein UlaG (beta-lactamase superfamily)
MPALNENIIEHKLIEPALADEALLAQIGSTRLEPRSIAFWPLGQSGFLIKSRFGTFVIDPYLSESLTRKYANTARPHVRMTRAPLRGADLSFVDLMIASHKHSDHLDPETTREILDASPRASLIIPEALRDYAVGLGLDDRRLIGLDAGGTVEFGGARIRAIPSAHEGLDVDDSGRHLYLGYVIEIDGIRLYHSGDTIVYDRLIGELGAAAFDLLFLPINGRDRARGVPGNMNIAEAIDLACAVRPRYVVPHHYDMFTFNSANVAEFLIDAERLPEGVAAIAPKCGERTIVSR